MSEVGGYSATRADALQAGDEHLTNLPWKKAAAIKRGIEILGNNPSKKFQSILDIQHKLTRPPQFIRVAHAPSPAVEMRDKIREKNPLDLDEEIGLDNLRKQEYIDSHTIVNQVPSEETSDTKEDGLLEHKLREIDQLFDRESGAVVVPFGWNLADSHLFPFFSLNKDRFRGSLKGSGPVELRGKRYFVSQDPEKDMDSRLNSVSQDIFDGLKYMRMFAESRQKFDQPEDIVLALGILDYLKLHSATLFHALTYQERSFLAKKENKQEYIVCREQLLNGTKGLIRMYYQTLLGLEYDSNKSLDEVINNLNGGLNYVRQSLGREFQSLPVTTKNVPEARDNWVNQRFKYPETNQPWSILLGALEAVKNYPQTDTIVGIPSGGTESAIVVQMAFEALGKGSLDLELVPVSVHSQIAAPTIGQVAGYLQAQYPERFFSKQVLLVDDNSGTGQTLETLSSALKYNGAEDVNIHLTDFLGLLLVKSPDGRLNFDHGHSPTTLGVTPLTKKGGFAYEAKIKDTFTDN